MNTRERAAAKKLLDNFVNGTMDNATMESYLTLMKAVSQRQQNEEFAISLGRQKASEKKKPVA